MLNNSQRVHVFYHQQLQYGGAIAVSYLSNKKQGLGGCRIIHGDFNARSIELCRNLAQCMDNKARLYDLPFAGAKSVIFINEATQKSRALEHLAKHIKQLDGKYVAAVDIGTDINDMNFLAQQTSHVSCHSNIGGDPSLSTAQGVYYAIQAASETLFNNIPLSESTVAIQGMGKVGSALFKLLAQSNVKLYVADINSDKLPKQSEKIRVVAADEITSVRSDILIPCAKENFICTKQLHTLQTKCIIAAANLAITDIQQLNALHIKGVLYLPDFLVNVGGLLQCTYQYDNRFDISSKMSEIKSLVAATIMSSLRTNKTPYQICLEKIININ